MKKDKTITITIITLAILIVAVLIYISLFGIYVQNEDGTKRNIIKDYKMGMEFTNTRVITGTISDEIASQTIYDSEGNVVTIQEEGVEYTEENGYTIEETKLNPEETRTVDNYRKSKEILKQKLKDLKIPEYNISLNEDNGEITIRIPNDEDADTTSDLIQTQGILAFIDTSTFEIVFDNTYIKNSQVVTSQGNLDVAVYMQIELTEEGINKLHELNETYKTTTEQVTNEDGTTEEQTTSKEVLILLNGMTLGTTVMENIVYNDTIMIPFIASNNSDELNGALREARIESTILNSGVTPLTYSFTEENVATTITLETVLKYMGVIMLIFLVIYVFLVLRFGARGFISMYFQIGFCAVLLLIVRLTNVTLTMEGIAGLLTAIILNYVFNYIMLKNVNEKDMYKKTNLAFLFYTLPVFMISIVFAFTIKENVKSFGLTIFWGIIMTYIYNFIFSKYVFKNLTGGKNEKSKNDN